MADSYKIEVIGALRVEKTLLDTERDLNRELKQATREARTLLMTEVREAAPQPRAGSPPPAGEEKGAGIESHIDHSHPGGLRRFAGSVKGGGTLISLTHKITIHLDDPDGDHLSTLFETGTGLYGPSGSSYSIWRQDGGVLGPFRGWGGTPGWVDPNPGKNPKKVPKYAHSVEHPGIHPDPFIEDTVRDQADAVDLLYDQAVARAVRGF
jgi:hypothetical protein